MLKIIHLEDSVTKAMDIAKAIRSKYPCTIDLVSNMAKGIELIDEANQKGKPYDLAITDMHYPLASGENADWSAGEIFVDTIKQKNIDLPVIICSTHNMSNRDALGCVWFNDLEDWEFEIVELIQKIVK